MSCNLSDTLVLPLVNNEFMLCFRHDKSIKHVNINQTGSFYYLQDRQFPSVCQLIEHYAHMDVPNLEGLKGIRLRVPIIYEPPGSSSNQRHTLASVEQYHNDTDQFQEGVSQEEVNNNQTVIRPRLNKQQSEIQLPIDRRKLAKSKSVDINVSKKSFLGLFRREKKTVDESNSVIRNNRGSNCSTESTGSQGRDRCHSDGGGERPPQPLPRMSDAPRSQSSSSANYYDEVRDTDTDLSAALVAQLSVRGAPTGRCECGLDIDESELPHGWTLHISHDPPTKGRIFFMDPEGVTSWNLPLRVSLQLTLVQQERIRELMERREASAGAMHVSGTSASHKQSGVNLPFVAGNSQRLTKPANNVKAVLKQPSATPVQIEGSSKMDYIDDDDDDVFI